MGAGEVHVGDVGTVFEATIYDEDGAVLDISSASEKKLTFLKTDKVTKLVVDADFVTNGTDGKLTYTSVENDIDQEGGWQIQGRVILPTGGPWHSDIYDHEIFPTL